MEVIGYGRIYCTDLNVPCRRSQKEGSLPVWCVIHKISSVFLFSPLFLLVHWIVTSLLLTLETL